MKTKIVIIVLILLVLIGIADLFHNLSQRKPIKKSDNPVAVNKTVDTPSVISGVPTKNIETGQKDAKNADPNNDYMKQLNELMKQFGTSSEKVLSMEWDTWQPRLSLTDKNALNEALNAVPVNNRAQSIGPAEIESLRRLTAIILNHIGTGNDIEYYNYLQNSGEIVKLEYLKRRKDAAAKYYNVPASSLPEDGWDFFRYLAEQLKPAFPDLAVQYPQTHLVQKGNGIELYEVDKPKFTMPGVNMGSLMNSMNVLGHCATPPISREEMINKYGKVALANVRLFIAHSPEQNYVVRPYNISLWFDPDYQVWRPSSLAIYPGRNEFIFVGLPF